MSGQPRTVDDGELGGALREALRHPSGGEPPLGLHLPGIVRAGKARRWRVRAGTAALTALAVILPVAIIEGLPRLPTRDGSQDSGASGAFVSAVERAFAVRLRVLGTQERDLGATTTGRDSWYVSATRTDPLTSCTEYSTTLTTPGKPPVVATCSRRTLADGTTALVWVGSITDTVGRVQDRVEVRSADGLWVVVDRLQPKDDRSAPPDLLRGALRLAGWDCHEHRDDATITWCPAG